jgi:hypothetical protein
MMVWCIMHAGHAGAHAWAGCELQDSNHDLIDPFDPTIDPFERSASAGGTKSPKTPPIAKIRAQFDIEARLISAPLRLHTPSPQNKAQHRCSAWGGRRAARQGDITHRTPSVVHIPPRHGRLRLQISETAGVRRAAASTAALSQTRSSHSTLHSAVKKISLSEYFQRHETTQ